MTVWNSVERKTEIETTGNEVQSNVHHSRFFIAKFSIKQRIISMKMSVID